MSRQSSPFRLMALLLTLSAAALPTPAFASGFQLMEQSASGLGNAFAGQAAGVKNATAIYFNPAALTRVPDWNLVVSAEPIGLGTTFADSASTRPFAATPGGPQYFPVPLGDEGGEAGKWILVPNAYLSGQVTERIWIGAAFNVPFGLETNWADTWMGRFHATKSKIETYNVNPTIALQLSDTLSVGGGASWQRLKADLGQNVPFGSVAYFASAQALAESGLPPVIQQALLASILAQLGGPAGLATEGPALISGDSTAWGWNAGALLKLGEQAHLGVSYRSEIEHELEGTATFTGAPELSESGPTGPIGAAVNSVFATGPVGTTVKMPATLSVALAWENDKVEVLADWTKTGWSSIRSLDITRVGEEEPLSSVPLNFEDSWRAGLGMNFKLSEKFTLRLGTAYDKAPVRDEFRTPRLPDTDRIWAAGGFQWRLGEKAAIDAGYAHLFIDDASSNLTEDSTSGHLVGAYKAKVDILGVQLSLRF